MNRVLQRVKKFLALRPFLGDNASEQIVEPERNQLAFHSQDLNA